VSFKNYIVVTPARNEEKRLPHLAKSMMSQSLKPILWVIIDDKSTDNTASIIQKIEEKYSIVKGFHIEENTDHIQDRYSFVVRKGFDFATKLCWEEGWGYDALAIVDADVVLDKNYFSELMSAFSRDRRLGIVAGIEFQQVGDRFLLKRNIEGESFSGAAWIFRRECYEEIGGFPTILCAEVVSKVKAMNRGWGITGLLCTRSFHTRRRGTRLGAVEQFDTKQGEIEGYTRFGERMYKLNYHPINALLNAFYLSFFGPGWNIRISTLGFVFLYGYFKALLLREEKIADIEIRTYFWKAFSRRVSWSFSRLVKKLPSS